MNRETMLQEAAPAEPVSEAASERCDVFVIGGGPGGAATAILLAQAGLDVVIAEKERHPRFHIGESLLPHSLPVLERLGVLEQVRAIGVHKPGAEFVSGDGARRAVFDFSRALTDGPPSAYQVRRADFDALLYARAEAVGARALSETTATIETLDDEGAVISTQGPDGARRIAADLLIDASGRSALVATRQGDKRPNPHNDSAAIFGHFRGVPRDEGDASGSIRVILTDPGWMWRIPLHDGVTSVGMVAPAAHLAARDCGLETFFRRHCERHPAAREMMRDAEPIGRINATGNYSYAAGAAAGPGHLKVGDAYGFLDPIFSTGVHLALCSAEEAAHVVLESRARPHRRRALTAAYDRRIRRRLAYVSWFAYRINDPVTRELLLQPRDVLGVERAVIALLAGDFARNPRIHARVLLFKLIRRLAGMHYSRKGGRHA